MGTTTPEELLKQWRLDQISVEMAMGHMLQNLVLQQEVLRVISTTLERLNLQHDTSVTLAKPKPKKKTYP